MSLWRRSIAALVMGALAAARAGIAHAQCTYPALLSGAAATATGVAGTKVTYQFNQSNVFWTAVGVRPDPGSDWDIGIYQSTAAFPTCVATLLGNSTRVSGADFVVGDFNHNPTGTYYVAASHFSGTGNGKVEWDDGPDLLTVNAPVVQQSTDATNVLQVWDVHLVQDSTYSFEFSHSGAADTHLLLFRNAGGGTLWEGRNAAEFDVSNSTQYKAPSTGYYGVVVVNDNGATGTFGVQVGECLPPIDLHQQQPLVTTGAENWYDFIEPGPIFGDLWVGAAVRANGGSSDWDCEVYSDRNGSYPECLSSPVGGSNQSPPKADFVLGNFGAYIPTGVSSYLRAHLYQDIGSGSAVVQLQDDRGQIHVNGSAIGGSTGPNDVFRLMTAALEAGKSYTFLLSKTGSANLKLLLFRNPVGGTYWTGRSNSEFEIAGPAALLYTAPATGNYAVVVVNDDGGTATWSLALGSCPAPTALFTSNIAGSSFATDYFSFNQQDPFWTAVATQSIQSNVDFDISAYSAASGNGYPTCESGLLANSQYGLGITDLVVGDFNHNAPGTYYVNDYAYQLAGSDADVEWDSGPDVVTVNGPMISRPSQNLGVAHIVEAWDVFLQAGHTYSFRMNQGGNGDWHLLLFRNPGGGTYWAGRSAAAFDVTSGLTIYTAPSTGFYGIVTANNNYALNYFYDFRVDEGVVSVDANAPTATGLTSVVPNPTRGSTNIDFALTNPGEVALDLLDTSGRRVASLKGSFEAGRQQLTWDGDDEAGARLPAGLYFVRMRVAGRDVGTRRITLLR